MSDAEAVLRREAARRRLAGESPEAIAQDLGRTRQWVAKRESGLGGTTELSAAAAAAAEPSLPRQACRRRTRRRRPHR
jgi:hypothetical protein